ncbi:hypothetical protein [Streptomyces fractus]|uniref:hypothetical protein n=1 Tax=Streptomyces fractus TaxID=641806 RepID=UPI003CF6344E
MGYDMFIETVSDHEAATVRAAEDAFHAAARARDALHLPPDHADCVAAQEKVERAYEALREADSSYFRLNIWGMSHYCEVMEQLGMVVSDYELPPFPHEPDGVTREEIDAFGDRGHGPDAPARPEVVAYWKQLEAHLSWHLDPAFGIALHKFCSNDGWLVTPEEIAAALESYRVHSAEEVKVIVGGDTEELDYWLQWISYLQRAQQRGGFRVW